MILQGNRRWKLLTVALLGVSIVTFLLFSLNTNMTPNKIYKKTKRRHGEHNAPNDLQQGLDLPLMVSDKKVPDFGDFEPRKKKRKAKGKKHKKKSTEGTEEEERPVVLTRSCPNLAKPSLDAKDTEFQYMPERHIYVYSAYYDVRDSPTIRVSGFSPRAPIPFYCQLYYPDGAVYSSRGLAFDFASDEEKSRKPKFTFKSYWYLCDEPLNKEPIAVSLTPDPCINNITNLVSIQVRNRTQDSEISPDVLVCVKTLYGFNSPYRIIEFLEYQKHFGVKNVAIYDYDRPSDAVRDVIKYYTNTGFIKTVPWKLPLKTSKHAQKGSFIRTYGQRTQINDCIFRFMNMYKYIVVIDMDEFLVPRLPQIQTYSQLVNLTMTHRNYTQPGHNKKRKKRKEKLSGQRSISSIMLPHVDFCLTKEQASSVKPDSLLFGIHKRGQPPLGIHDRRMKCIVNPRAVVAMDEHHVSYLTRHQRKRKPVRLSPFVALLYHYRQHHPIECIFNDTTTDRYKVQLVKKVNEVCTKINIEPWRTDQ